MARQSNPHTVNLPGISLPRCPSLDEELFLSPLIAAGQPLTPARLADSADNLELAVKLLEGYGLVLGGGNRLQMAVAHLRAVAARGEFPEDREGLLRTGNAIRIAHDFRRFVNVTGEGLPDGLRATAQRATGGRLDDVGGTEAHQAQTELLWGAIAVAGGLLPTVPPGGATKRPDYVIQSHGIEVGLEVKRVGSRKKLERHIREAVEQASSLRARHGAVVLDMSDLLTPNAEEAVLSAVHRNALEIRFQGLVRDTERYITSERGRGPFGGLVGLAMAAEAFLWQRDTMGKIEPAARAFYHLRALRIGRAELVPLTAEGISEALLRGIHQLGGTLLEIRQVP